MSVFERVFGVVKSAMLMNEQFESIETSLKDLSRDVVDLGRSHADLAQRVARLEGFLEGAAATRSRAPRLSKD